MTSSISSNFWMIALPLKHREKLSDASHVADEDRNVLYSFLKDKLSVSTDLAEVHQFSFPEFKVGTLDSLVNAGEDLAKMDPQFESTVQRLVNNLRNLLEKDHDQVKNNLIINEVTTPEAFIKSFQWNTMKYRPDRVVTEIAETLVQEAQQIDNLLKARLSTYSQSRSAMSAIERRNTGTLLTKDLAAYVKEDDFIQESEFMVTLLVVVPKLNSSDWETNYEHLSEMVVPRSSKLLAEEGDLQLYNVTVFKKFKDEFIKEAAKQKFTVREFVFDVNLQKESKEAEEAIKSDLKAQWSNLVRLLKTNFGELFSAWIHLKVLRLFVESVLHYGLPPQFLALIVKPKDGKDNSKSEKKLKIALLQQLEQLQLPGISSIEITTALHNANASIVESAEEAELWTALNLATRDEDPFVKIPLKLNF